MTHPKATCAVDEIVLWARRDTLEDLEWRLRTRWSEHRSYLIYSRYRNPLNVVDDRMQLVIEAFPRSANTFATMGFQLSQPAPVRVAHHLHTPALIAEVVRRGIPVLVVVRHPRDAATSQVIRSPGTSVASALSGCAGFHERMATRTESQIATFDQVPGDFGALIHALNRRFGTNFGVFQHTSEAVAEVYRMIDQRAREHRLARGRSVPRDHLAPSASAARGSRARAERPRSCARPGRPRRRWPPDDW